MSFRGLEVLLDVAGLPLKVPLTGGDSLQISKVVRGIT